MQLTSRVTVLLYPVKSAAKFFDYVASTLWIFVEEINFLSLRIQRTSKL